MTLKTGSTLDEQGHYARLNHEEDQTLPSKTGQKRARRADVAARNATDREGAGRRQRDFEIDRVGSSKSSPAPCHHQTLYEGFAPI